MNLENHKIKILLISVVLLIASFFYFYHITQRGFFNDDEALFMLTAHTYSQIPHIALDHFFNAKDNFKNTIKKYLPGIISFSTSERPLYIFFDTFGIWLFGSNDFSAFIVNGLISLGAIIILYLIARIITGDFKKALLAAFLFAISGYQIYFARSGFSQILSGFFMLFGSLFYLKTLVETNFYNIKIHKNLIIAGFLWGLMLMSHYNTITILFLIFIFEILLCYFFYNHSINILLKRLVCLIIPLLGALFVVQIFTVLRNYFLVKASYTNQINTYFDDIKDVYIMLNEYQKRGIGNYHFFAEMLKNLNGWPYLVLFLVSPVIFIYRKWYLKPAFLFVFFITILNFILISLVSVTVTRTAIPIGGFISLIAALVFYEIIIYFQSYKIITVIIFLLLIIPQFQIDWQIVNLKSGYKEASEFLKTTDFPKEDIYSGSWPILAFYLNEKVQILDRKPSYVYYVADFHTDQFYLDLEKKGQLVATFANSAYDFIPTQGDATYLYSFTNESEKINIYKVKIH